jgi:hypothetical protein
VSGQRWDPSTLRRRQGPDGATYLEPTQPICDFCLGPDPTWEFPAARMPIKGHPLIDQSDDEWGACDECKALIEAHKLGPLVERCVEGQLAMEIPANFAKLSPALLRRTLRENLLRFMDARRGPAVPYRV